MTIREGAPNVDAVATLDLAPGTGATVKSSDTVTMDYCGVGLATRTAFDSSWVHGGAFPVPLPKVIPGWRDAIVGMKVGGTRLMLVPASQAFGAKPPKGSGISPNETIAFVVTVQGTGA
jgi:peptidylprolyl isomerase